MDIEVVDCGGCRNGDDEGEICEAFAGRRHVRKWERSLYGGYNFKRHY